MTAYDGPIVGRSYRKKGPYTFGEIEKVTKISLAHGTVMIGGKVESLTNFGERWLELSPTVEEWQSKKDDR